LFILKEGRVRLYHLEPDGRMLTLAILEEGTIFGEMTMLGQKLQSNFAEALTPCLLCLMSREDVKSALLSDPRIAFRLMATIGQRLVFTEQRLSDMAFKHAPERIATQLVQLAQQRRGWLGRKPHPEVRCTHEELAHLVGVHRETVTKVLNEFRQKELIELGRGRVHLARSPWFTSHTQPNHLTNKPLPVLSISQSLSLQSPHPPSSPQSSAATPHPSPRHKGQIVANPI
jgi:CRP/FNR family cyclic AMP-dependent transcriptional regulator